MEYDSQDSFLVIEERVMACSYQIIKAAQDRISRELGPCARNTASGGVAHSVVLRTVIVARVRQEVALAYLNYVGPFVHASHLILPALRYGKAFTQGAFLGRDVIVLQFSLPDAVAVCKTYEEHIGLAVIIEENVRVNTLLVANQLLHLVGAYLLKGTFRGICSGGKQMLVGREVHNVMSVLVVHLGCPEPLLLCGVGLVQGLPLVLPGTQVVRGIASDAAGIMRSVGIVLAVIQQDVGICQRNLADFSFCLGCHRSCQYNK